MSGKKFVMLHDLKRNPKMIMRWSVWGGRRNFAKAHDHPSDQEPTSSSSPSSSEELEIVYENVMIASRQEWIEQPE